MKYFYAVHAEGLDDPATLQPPIISKRLIDHFRNLREIEPNEAYVRHYQAYEGDIRIITEAPSGKQIRYSLFSKNGEWHVFRCDSSQPS